MVKTLRFILFLFLSVSLAEAATTIPLNIEEMTDVSDRIFVGTVLRVNFEVLQPQNIPTIATTFSVHEGLKGDVQGEVTVYQLAASAGQKRWRTFVGLPTFREGERTVVFLTAESSLGLSTAVGLTQGVFRIVGKESNLEASPVLNQSRNRMLLRRLQGQQTQALARAVLQKGKAAEETALTLADLKRLVAAHRGLE